MHLAGEGVYCLAIREDGLFVGAVIDDERTIRLRLLFSPSGAEAQKVPGLSARLAECCATCQPLWVAGKDADGNVIR